MRRGAVILCGGRSSRMGSDKSLLPFGNETMLERIVRTLNATVPSENTFVIAAVNQNVPNLAATVIRDRAEDQGPFMALASGLEALFGSAEVVFVTGCDTPLLSKAVVDYLFDRVGEFDCIVPQDANRLYPLCSVYRSSLLCSVRAYQGRSLRGFVQSVNARFIPCEDLRKVDPNLESLRNINSHLDYVAALAVAGLSTP